MNCPRCSQWNCEDEHRCVKCANRLNDRRVPSAFHQSGALALQEYRVHAQSAVALEERPVTPVSRPPRYAGTSQQSLFSLRDPSKIVSIAGETESAPRRQRGNPSRERRRPVSTSFLSQQGVLEFLPVHGPEPRRLATTVEALIDCDYPVASLTHRAVAACYDAAIVLIMACIFFGVLYSGCDGLLESLSDPVCAGVLFGCLVLLGIIYEAFHLAFTGQTPGMRWAGLRLVNFDGNRSTESQILMRIVGIVVSVLPVTAGLLWAFVDEESLTWKDHISNTFPTPAAPRR